MGLPSTVPAIIRSPSFHIPSREHAPTLISSTLKMDAAYTSETSTTLLISTWYQHQQWPTMETAVSNELICLPLIFFRCFFFFFFFFLSLSFHGFDVLSPTSIMDFITYILSTGMWAKFHFSSPSVASSSFCCPYPFIGLPSAVCTVNSE
jgi:hypothetical protein